MQLAPAVARQLWLPPHTTTAMMRILGMHACCQHGAAHGQCRTRGLLLFVVGELSKRPAPSTSVQSFATCAAYKHLKATVAISCSHCRPVQVLRGSQVTLLSLPL